MSIMIQKAIVIAQKDSKIIFATEPYFAYVSANSTVTHHIRIFLIPSINLTSNAKIL